MSGPSLAPIVRALGGDLYARGQRASIPGPGHRRGDRSVSLALAGRRVLVHCFAGDDWREVLDDLRRRGLVDGAGHVTGFEGAGDGRGPDRPGCRARAAAAQRLWSEAQPIAGTVAERHLRRRGIRGDPGPELRCHSGVPAAVYDDRGPRRPALLAAIRTPHGALVGVEVTYLAPNGARARLAIPRKTIGLSPSGAAVRLDPAGPRLLVGEGVFSCLSAAAWFGLPAWALLSVRGLRRWRPPDEVRFVLIAADRGRPGEGAARALARDLAVLGVRAEVRLPPPPHGDWNEALGDGVEAGEAEEGRVRAGAADGRSGAAGPEIRSMTSETPHDDGLVLIPDALRPTLLANAHAGGSFDPVPVLKLFNPAGPGTWLITELDADGDTIFGLCDLDMGCPELGSVSLAEITSVKLPFGLTIERDVAFQGRVPLSKWAEIARRTGSIRQAESIVRTLAADADRGLA